MTIVSFITPAYRFGTSSDCIMDHVRSFVRSFPYKSRSSNSWGTRDLDLNKTAATKIATEAAIQNVTSINEAILLLSYTAHNTFGHKHLL